MAEKGDPFRDLVFSGAPSEYRHFRRKILLNVASLEEKHVKLAGPKILTRLTGEAWRATEHLSISELRSEDGWLRVLQALDGHYKYLPETELNECVDEFLFHLKRKAGEGPTAFVSRFKAVLSRLETLIAAERAQRKTPKRKRESILRRPDAGGHTEQEESETSGGSSGEPPLTKERVDAAAASAGDPSAKATDDTKGPKTVGSFVGEKSPKRGPPSSGGSHRSRGTQKADDDRAQRRMLESLGRLEVGHLKLKPIFPAVILGHLFMRKYGLNREQRSQVIRSTGGSCKFEDIEKVIRASDYEDRLGDGHRGPAQRPHRGAVMAAEEESSCSEPSFSDPEALEADVATGSEVDEEYEEAYEVHKKAKQDAKRAYRSYKDSRKKVREIKKERQPYMPVVALPAGSANPADGLPVQPTFKYDHRKEGRKPDRDRDRAKGGRKGRREEVSMVHGAVLTEFSYMVEDQSHEASDADVFATCVPTGMAVVDTGCTTSVIGQDTAAKYASLWAQKGLPEPVKVALPPVQLKGFNGMKSLSGDGLRWTVLIGQLWGQITTYVIPGTAPFLLSRKVLQGMEATLNLKDSTITSQRHGMEAVPLAQASNGHLLMSLLPDAEGEAVFHTTEAFDEEVPGSNNNAENKLTPTPENTADPKCRLTAPTQSDLRRCFQTVMKHTRYTQADVGTYKNDLRLMFGQSVDFALCAYRPRFERVPKPAATRDLYRAVAHLAPSGALEVSEWVLRPASTRRENFDRAGACIFAYRHQPPEAQRAAVILERVQGRQPKAKGRQAKVLDPEIPVEHKDPSTTVLAEAGSEAPPASEQCDCCEPETPEADEITLGPAFEVDFHMCANGLVCKNSKLPIKRPTRIVTSDPALAEGLRRCRCPNHTEHAHILATQGLRYPRLFCRSVAACLARRDTEVLPTHDVFLETDDEADSERESEPDVEMPEDAPDPQVPRQRSYKAMVQKLHVNTGHASIPQMLRLAQRARAPTGVVEEIRKFKCPVCEELQVPPSHKVELKKDGVSGIEERKFQVLTVVDYASDFAQQIVLPPGPRSVATAFHAVWCRPYGPPRVVYVDPDQRWMSEDFQKFLRCNSITLLDSATESHWQLGRVEVAQKILRMMAQRVWRTTERPAEEVIESCCSVRNEQLKRHGFSSAQWFLGREPRVPGSLADISEQRNPAVQDAVHAETDFAQKMQVRHQAAEAFAGKVSLLPGMAPGSALDEVVFKQLAQEFYSGRLPDELEQVSPAKRGPAGRFFDITGELPMDADFLTLPGSDQEGEPAEPPSDRNVRRRITRDDEYWRARASEPSPRGEPLVRVREDPPNLEEPSSKVARVEEEHPIPETPLDYSPSLPPAEPSPSSPLDLEDLPPVSNSPLDGQSEAEDLPDADNLCCELSFDVFSTDITSDIGCLWDILDECAVTAARPGQKRRVEVSLRKLGAADRNRFKGAMRKEWQSWLENKVTTIVKGKGIPKSRVIGSRWVLTWKKSSDPDDKTLSPKARLVLVGFQDPDLGRIATDSPTLRKESKHIILSICASKGWVIWGADIKTAFLSGDASNRDLYNFRPHDEVREFMQLDEDDILRLEKAAYGLAEAPRAWFLRLTRELCAVGLVVSQLDPCVFLLRCESTNDLLGVCGTHVDDLLGGGTTAMDKCLQRLKRTLPFGDFRRTTIKYTGAEIRQLPDMSIEVSQEAYIDKMEEVCTKPFGKASNRLPEPTLMRACCGQLAWVANHSRPEQSFLASYLQGTQDKAEVSHLELYNKAVRELKTRKVTLKFPCIPISRWRLLAITDAGWGVRANGESQGGLILCLCDQDVLERKPGATWVIEWSSKKLRRVVRSSTAAETLAAQNGLDAIEFAQSFLQEVLYGMSPKVFQQWTPENPSGLVIDSKSLYDALTRSACSSALAMEKRLAIDYAIARACLSERCVQPYWTKDLRGSWCLLF
ncbi:RE1 [Symbiodinium sp. CCMP2592]|nr:RE1 [Symbiodinium sp. CCMP2592]